MGPRILLVDDEPHIRSFLRAYLEAERFQVLEAETGPEALDCATDPEQQVALVLLDVGLPGLDGIEVLRRLRALGDLPVILVTARAEEVDKLIGLAVGADDYIDKPVSPREVVARVKAVLRRSQGAAAAAAPPADGSLAEPGAHREATEPGDPDGDTEDRLALDGLVLDRARREVRRDGEDVYLTALEFDLLNLLASSPGRVFTRPQLLRQIWGYDHLGDERVVDVHVRNIRKRLADDATDPRFIGTVRGVGYKFLRPAAGSA